MTLNGALWFDDIQYLKIMAHSDIILSILVICHNQKHLLPRCMESVLRQIITFPYEIIISDDRSTDGSWELIKTYEKQFPDLIFGQRINSDECDPVNTNERCGYNKVCAYKRSRGKYFATIDSDDFLTGNDIYQKQLEILENNPDCSICMQNVWCIRDGDTLEQGRLWELDDTYVNGQILDAKDIILLPSVVLNQAFMNRRYDLADPFTLYGRHFDDRLITYHQLQYGKAVYLNRHDYVYVRYKSSIDANIKDDNREVLYNLLSVYHTIFIPRFAGFFLKGGLSELIHLVKLGFERKVIIDSETKDFLSEFDGFIFNYFRKKNRNTYDKTRLLCIRILLLSLKKWSIDSSFLFRLTYALMTSYREMVKIPNENWETK